MLKHNKVLILGSNGMLGHTLLGHLLTRDINVVGTSRSPQSTNEIYFDILLNNFQKILQSTKPNVVINCIGMIKQKIQNSDIQTIYSVNSFFPKILDRLCIEHGAKLIHISTDCVFDGLLARGDRYTEKDIPNAIDTYGQSKALGEISYPNLTLRTSIIGKEIDSNLSLLEWMFSQKDKQIHGYTDHYYSGITTLELSKIILKIINEPIPPSGLYQISSGVVSKFTLLGKINEIFNLGVDIIPDNTTYCNRSLDGSLFNERMAYSPPSWDEMLMEFNEEYKIVRK